MQRLDLVVGMPPAGPPRWVGLKLTLALEKQLCSQVFLGLPCVSDDLLSKQVALQPRWLLVDFITNSELPGFRNSGAGLVEGVDYLWIVCCI